MVFFQTLQFLLQHNFWKFFPFGGTRSMEAYQKRLINCNVNLGPYSYCSHWFFSELA